MKFMLMMNAQSGNGDWGVSKWPPEDLKAHIGFMKKSAGPGKGGAPLNMPIEVREVMSALPVEV